MQRLTLSIAHEVATITLNNPPQNRIDDQMVDELNDALEQISANRVRAVLLQGDGENFSFGGDIEPWPDAPTNALRGRFERYMNAFNRFERLPIPVVAAVKGLCLGGGFELALRADVIIAASSAKFGHPEQTLGIVTLLGGVYRVAERAGRARASEWAMTSQPVPADEMERFGVVNRVVADDELGHVATSFVQKLAEGPTRAYAAHKALLRIWAVSGVSAADEAIFDIAMPLFETNDVQTGIRSAVDALRAGKPRPVLRFNGK
jgi:enoyl-CoA hydratase/carnithine racemase